jgi:hypothetical protein
MFAGRCNRGSTKQRERGTPRSSKAGVNSMARTDADIETYPRALTTSGHSNACLIVGAGPAGLAPLVAAARSEKLRALLDEGITIVESSTSAGCGEIGSYTISSDSAAEAFLDAITQAKYPELTALRDHLIVKTIASRIGQSVPLSTVARFLELIGDRICEMVRSSRHGQVLMLHRALYTRQTSEDSWVTCVRDERLGTLREIRSRSVILATGADQPISRLYTEKIADEPLLPAYACKVIQSGYVLTAPGLRQVRKQLDQHKEPKVVIVGGSTSAGAVARVLLTKRSGFPFVDNGITLMHRRPLRIFYPSAADALQDGYTDFGCQDICPVSGRVYRLAGFRLETRELMMRVLRVGGRDSEPRLRLHQIIAERQGETSRLLEEAHLIVAAMGYRPRALPVFNVTGDPIDLQCARDEMMAMVDFESTVIDDCGRQIVGLYGIGLASGFVPHGRFGGEPSFRGQANSLWLWQHDVGEQIADGVLHRAETKGYPSSDMPRGTAVKNIEEREEVLS